MQCMQCFYYTRLGTCNFGPECNKNKQGLKKCNQNEVEDRIREEKKTKHTNHSGENLIKFVGKANRARCLRQHTAGALQGSGVYDGG